MRKLKLLGRRILVAALGVASVWFILFIFFDVADRKLPLVLALALTYGVAAYLILPRIIRLGAKILQRGHVPSYTLTGDGLAGDPVNIALVGTMEELTNAFRHIGWATADQLGVASSWKMAKAFALGQPYPTAPFSTLYLFGRGQDVGFQLAIGNSPRKRHHVRFWGISIEQVEKTLDTEAFWARSLAPTVSERAVWVGAATKDTGFSLTRLSFQITHATDADTNAERDFLIDELAKGGVAQQVRSHMPGERLSIGKVNRYVTDGVVSVAELKSPGPAS